MRFQFMCTIPEPNNIHYSKQKHNKTGREVRSMTECVHNFLWYLSGSEYELVFKSHTMNAQFYYTFWSVCRRRFWKRLNCDMEATKCSIMVYSPYRKLTVGHPYHWIWFSATSSWRCCMNYRRYFTHFKNKTLREYKWRTIKN